MACSGVRQNWRGFSMGMISKYVLHNALVTYGLRKVGAENKASINHNYVLQKYLYVHHWILFLSIIFGTVVFSYIFSIVFRSVLLQPCFVRHLPLGDQVLIIVMKILNRVYVLCFFPVLF